MRSQTQNPGPAGPEAEWEAWDASPAGRADAAGRQQGAAGTLGEFLAEARKRGLPPASWTVTCTEPQLLARCDGYPKWRRPHDFAEWKAALTALGGTPVYEGERAFAKGGQTRASAVWETLRGVRVSLSAEWDTAATASRLSGALTAAAREAEAGE